MAPLPYIFSICAMADSIARFFSLPGAAAGAGAFPHCSKIPAECNDFVPPDKKPFPIAGGGDEHRPQGGRSPQSPRPQPFRSPPRTVSCLFRAQEAPRSGRTDAETLPPAADARDFAGQARRGPRPHTIGLHTVSGRGRTNKTRLDIRQTIPGAPAAQQAEINIPPSALAGWAQPRANL